MAPDDSNESKLPAWQRNQHGVGTGYQQAWLHQARRFLADDAVRAESDEKKTEFLKSKGLADDDIQELLGSNRAAVTDPEGAEAPAQATMTGDSTVLPAAPTGSASGSQPPNDTAPIVTYPEFLLHSRRPPPLVTPERLLKGLTITGTILWLVYGAARFVVKPMVDRLNEARSEYYGHANAKLGHLVQKLESMVSVVPHKNGEIHFPAVDDDSSNYDDPTELFHRDVGTQTATRPHTSSSAVVSEEDESVMDYQERQSGRLLSKLKELCDLVGHRAESVADTRAMVAEVREEQTKLLYPPPPEYTSVFGGSGFGLGGRSSDPDDASKRLRDDIRRVKGLLLSARSFPGAAAT